MTEHPQSAPYQPTPEEMQKRLEVIVRKLKLPGPELSATRNFCSVLLKLFSESDGWAVGWKIMTLRLYEDELGQAAAAGTHERRDFHLGRAHAIRNLDEHLIAWARAHSLPETKPREGTP